METGVRSQQDGRGQRGAHAHETTLPFVGRVVGHVQLYGERGRGSRESRAPREITRDQECQQQPAGLKITGRNAECRRNPDAKKNTFAKDACSHTIWDSNLEP